MALFRLAAGLRAAEGHSAKTGAALLLLHLFREHQVNPPALPAGIVMVRLDVASSKSRVSPPSFARVRAL